MQCYNKLSPRNLKRVEIKALAHITQSCKDSSKKVGEKIFAHIKNCQKIVAVVKKVVMCTEDTAFFAVLCVVCDKMR